MSCAILVVDDEHDLAETCQRLLTRRGWQVATVATREAALAALSADVAPVLAIVDRLLPDGDGLDVVRAARDRGCRVLVISGRTAAANRDRMLAAGAAGFLGKPFSASQFLELVHRIAGDPPTA